MNKVSKHSLITLLLRGCNCKLGKTAWGCHFLAKHVAYRLQKAAWDTVRESGTSSPPAKQDKMYVSESFKTRFSVITSRLRLTETKFENPPLGMIEGSVLKSLRRHRAADCFTTSNVSLIISQMYLPTTRTLDNNNGLPGHEQLWNVSTKCFGHVLGANVGDALKSKRNVHRVPENGKNGLSRFILKV